MRSRAASARRSCSRRRWHCWRSCRSSFSAGCDVSTRRGTFALVALGLAAVALFAVELALGALSAGETHLADPCTSQPAFDGGGFDGAVQRFALTGLNGA